MRRSSASYTCGTSAPNVTRSPASSSTGRSRADAQAPGDHDQVLDHAGVVRVRVPDGARLEVERVEVERAAACDAVSSRPAQPGVSAECIAGTSAARTTRSAGPLLLDDPRERHAAARRRSPTASRRSGSPLPDSSCASVDLPSPAAAARSASVSPRLHPQRARTLAATARTNASTRVLFHWTKFHSDGIIPSSWKRSIMADRHAVRQPVRMPARRGMRAAAPIAIARRSPSARRSGSSRATPGWASPRRS